MTSLTFDERGFGTSGHVTPWSGVQAVGIRTSADGPRGEDVFWMMVVGDGMIEIPGAWLTGDAIGVMQGALPGIDSRKIVEAMGTTRERIFRIWSRGEAVADRDPQRLRDRFQALNSRLGAGPGVRETSSRLLAAWGEPHRRYHDHEHLAECLRALDEVGPPGSIGDAVELALFYHDAVYEPDARGNEAASAAWLETDAARIGLPGPTTALASRLVRATAHQTSTTVPKEDEAAVGLVRDIDLAILGQGPLRFMEYEYGICEEYASIAKRMFRRGRRRLLRSLLAAPSIYQTPHFRHRYEARARANLHALLASPRYATWWQRLAGAASPSRQGS